MACSFELLTAASASFASCLILPEPALASSVTSANSVLSAISKVQRIDSVAQLKSVLNTRDRLYIIGNPANW